MTKYIDYASLPEALRHGARLWIEHHVEPGDFLCAVIQNDLAEAASRADEANSRSLSEIVSWFYINAPVPCWGSKEKFEAWSATGRAKKEGES
jgi:hypothetical protein